MGTPSAAEVSVRTTAVQILHRSTEDRMRSSGRHFDAANLRGVSGVSRGILVECPGVAQKLTMSMKILRCVKARAGALLTELLQGLGEYRKEDFSFGVVTLFSPPEPHSHVTSSFRLQGGKPNSDTLSVLLVMGRT